MFFPRRAGAEADRRIAELAAENEALRQRAGELEETLAACRSESDEAGRKLADWGRLLQNMERFGASLASTLEVYKVFMGVSEKGADDFANHTACRLGKCYYEGEGKHCFAKFDGYAAMEAPHIAVYRHGRDALAAYSAGDFAAGNRALEQMEAASHEVLACLERMAVCGESHPEIRCAA